MAKGHLSRVFLWALEKQKWLKDLISGVEPGGNDALSWYTHDGKCFMIVKVSRRDDGHAAVTVHKLENDEKFWRWERHRWDEKETKTGFGYMSLIRSGRYPATFRKAVVSD